MRINIIGRGNVGSHLVEALQDKAEVTMVNPHAPQTLDTDADITLIAVSDAAIGEVLAQLPPVAGIVAHASGTTDMSVFDDFGINRDRVGVFYPMQTFTKGKELCYEKIPFFLEAKNKADLEELRELARKISPLVYDADSERRRALHIAAVMSCNFVNHLFAMSEQWLQENGLDFKIMLPLIEETVQKISEISPKQAQTGPAVRKDYETMQRHEQALAAHPEMLEIYRLMSKSIMG